MKSLPTALVVANRLKKSMLALAHPSLKMVLRGTISGAT